MKRTLAAAAVAFALPFLSLAETRETVVFVEAHPDDLPGHLGTALRLSEKYDVHIIDFTHGELGCGWEKFTNGWTKATRIAERKAESNRVYGRNSTMQNVELIGVFSSRVKPGNTVFDGMSGVTY